MFIMIYFLSNNINTVSAKTLMKDRDLVMH